MFLNTLFDIKKQIVRIKNKRTFVELVREMPDNIKEFVRERKWYKAKEQIDKFLLCEKLNSTLNNMRKNESGVLCKAKI